MNEPGEDHSWSRSKRLRKAAVWVGGRLDPLVALLCGITAALGGIFGLIKGDSLTVATLGVLSAVAFSLVHERTLRIRASKSISDVLAQVRRARDSIKALETARPYQVLVHSTTWDIDEGGRQVHVRRKKQIRFAQNEVISLSDWSAGDGNVESTYYTPGKPCIRTKKPTDATIRLLPLIACILATKSCCFVLIDA